MSALVHRDGAHQITVHDEAGREITLVSQEHTLHITTCGEVPHLTPQMAHELAEELHQWAFCQQTVRMKTAGGTKTAGRIKTARFTR